MFYSFLYFTLGLAVTLALKGPFTQDFAKFLSMSDEYSDLQCLQHGVNGSFGGRSYADQKIRREPVIFIHGNSDGALANGKGPFSFGWTNSISYFLRHGYTSAELYALTWGDRNLANAVNRLHSCDHLKRIRNFIEAVLKYTESAKIDIISHSMGVTLARKAIKGGRVTVGRKSFCNLGESLTERVDTFVGIAGANFGMCSCTSEIAEIVPACSYTKGFWSGDVCSSQDKEDYSNKEPLTCLSATETDNCDVQDYALFLKQLNADKAKEADFVVSVWSKGDKIIGNGGLTWGTPTGLIPNSDEVLIYENLTHEDVKSMTAKAQYDAVTKHSFV